MDIEKYFTLPNEKISRLDPSKIPFDFVDQNSKKLLVTIGDSWSWGDELSHRLECCYGSLLSKKLEADWLNLSPSGAGNHYIGQLYLDLVAYIKQHNKYEAVLCVIVFTETGRDFNGWFDREIDYASWLRNNIKKHTDYDRFLEYINDFSIDRILENKVDGIELLCAFNFVNPSSIDKLKNSLVKKTWIEVCANQNLDNICYFVSPYIFKKLESTLSIEWSLNRQKFLTWQIGNLEATQKRLHMLEDSRYFYPRLHPKETGHAAWAEYLYTEIKHKGSRIVK